MTKIGAAFSVRFLRNGDQISITRDILNQSGGGAGLFQTIDATSGVVAPDWTKAANQPIIRIGLSSSSGYPVEIKSCIFAYNGTTLSFTYNGSTYVTASNDSRFQSRIFTDDNGKQYYELKIVGNIASKTELSNKQITYEVTYVSNALTDSISGGCDILIQQAGSDSHLLQIITDHVRLDSQITSCTLTAVCMYGTQEVTIDNTNYSIEWYQDNTKLSDKISPTLTVTRGMVEGGSVFVAKLLKSGSVVAQDAQSISDIADEYQLVITPTNAGKNIVSTSNSAQFIVKATKNGSEITISEATWYIYNAKGEQVRIGSFTRTPENKNAQIVIEITSADCLIDAKNGVYGDVDVKVEATATA